MYFCRSKKIFFNKEDVSYVNSGETNILFEGSMSSRIGFDRTWNLNSKNGEYINFYIENIGDANIIAKINDISSSAIEPGNKDCISVKVVNGKNYRFKTMAEISGDIVEMKCVIAQEAETNDNIE